jgi:hypothetical protein
MSAPELTAAEARGQASVMELVDELRLLALG